jgi:hypothetical protein
MTSKELAVNTPRRQSRGPPRPNHANHQSQKSQARDLPLQLTAPPRPPPWRPQSRPCAPASSPPTVFNAGHDARRTPHHEGCSVAAPEERCYQTSDTATPAAFVAWPCATSEDTIDLHEATHYDLLGADPPRDSAGTPPVPRWLPEPYRKGRGPDDPSRALAPLAKARGGFGRPSMPEPLQAAKTAIGVRSEERGKGGEDEPAATFMNRRTGCAGCGEVGGREKGSRVG